MSRPREPVDLLIAKGKKHLTKKEEEQRRKEEISIIGNKDKIKPPSYLGEALSEEFSQISDRLVEIGIMTDLDNDCLARYLLSKQLYLKYTSFLTEAIGKSKISNIEKYMNLQDKAFKQCRAAASDLGLSISSRCKLIMPNIEKEEKVNKFAKFKAV